MTLRILVLGAGAVGGYFGGRLLQAGADVAFLVRPARAAALAAHGLRIASPCGDATLPVRAVTEAGPGWNIVLLACKAYDLSAAIAAIRPAMQGDVAVLPVLNGIAHLDALDAAFGAGAVLPGLAKIQATLGADGVVRHLNDWRFLGFGERGGEMTPRATALAAMVAAAPGVLGGALPDIMHRLWEKLVHLGTAAIGTVLLRANVGEIVRAGGAPFLHEVLARNAAIAAANGHPMTSAFLDEYRALFADPNSAYATSMLRDLEAGSAIEAEHVIGHLHDAARDAGIPADIHATALLHARAYAARRNASRLPKPY